MPSDPYYSTKEWKALRRECLKRDGYRCTVVGCASTHRLSADHIISRRKGGSDALHNLRTLCGVHDAQLKESATGQRRSNGKPRIIGYDAQGRPLDPAHPWAEKR